MIFAPWMIEESYKYYMAASILHNSRNMGAVAQVNAALSVEILLKSFHVEVVENLGEVNEKYRFDKSTTVCKSAIDTHDLYKLYESLPDEIRKILWSPTREDILRKYRDVFVRGRYKYEKGSTIGYTGLLMQHAGEMINSVVHLYKREGCDDLWINSYPEV